jgi:hypothetical protein
MKNMLTSRDAVIGFRSRATAVGFFNGLLGEPGRSTGMEGAFGRILGRPVEGER